MLNLPGVLSRGLSTAGRRVACHDHGAARRWATRAAMTFDPANAGFRIRAASNSRYCYAGGVCCTSLPETRRCVRGPARGSRSVLASAAPPRACRRMIRTWRCHRRRRPSPLTAARRPRGNASRRQWTCTGRPGPNGGSPPRDAAATTPCPVHAASVRCTDGLTLPSRRRGG